VPHHSWTRRARHAGARTLLLTALALPASAPVAPALAQTPQPQPQQPPRPADAAPGSGQAPTGLPTGARPIPRGVLGGVPMTAADSGVQRLVGRLDFESYKGLIKGLTQFGDREQGTERNARANDWIEAKLREWGYETARIQYNYTPRGGGAPQPREEVYATKVGASVPGEMYIVGAHMDGRGGGEAANDDASGTALVMEIARVLAASDVTTARSVRFALWNNEETGLEGARAYVEQRAPLQGREEPRGSRRYPEPKWLGMIQHDMMLWDHGNPVGFGQVLDADVDIEYQLNSAQAEASGRLALQLLNANRTFATDYPAVVSNAMSNTDSGPFQDLIPAVSLRENRRLYETGRGANPHWHRPTDLYVNFTDADFRLGFNAMQTTLGAVARLAEARVGDGQQARQP
jgi:hypothetical protein